MKTHIGLLMGKETKYNEQVLARSAVLQVFHIVPFSFHVMTQLPHRDLIV